MYSVVDSPDIALVVPTDGSRLHLVEQYRYPVGARSLGVPGGDRRRRARRRPGATAARELREETGLVAGSLTALGSSTPHPGR